MSDLDAAVEAAHVLAARILDDGGDISATVWIEALAEAARALSDAIAERDFRDNAGGVVRVCGGRRRDEGYGEAASQVPRRPARSGGGGVKPEYRQYRRTQIAEMADWSPGFDMNGVSVSEPDREAGSPKPGDKIARNPANHADRWLVAAAYFAANFEPVAEGER